MRKLYREEVEQQLADAAVEIMGFDEAIGELKDLLISGFSDIEKPYRDYSNEELEEEWLDVFDEEMKIVDSKEE